MAFNFYVGRLVGPAGVGSQSYTGIGFQPKALLFFPAGASIWEEAANKSDFHFNGGVVTGTDVGDGVASMLGSNSWVWPPQIDNSYNSSVAGRCLAIGGFVFPRARANLVSFDVDGFTLNYVTLNYSNLIIYYIALGGDDLSAQVIPFDMKTSTGEQAVVGAGFQPDAVLLWATSSLDETWERHAKHSLGCFTKDDLNGAAIGFSADDAATTKTVCRRVHSASDCLLVPDFTTGISAEANGVSLDADGFTLNWSSAPGSAFKCYALCLKGPQMKLLNWQKKTSSGSQSITGVGFQPKGWYGFSYLGVDNNKTVIDDMQVSRYGSDGTNARGVWSSDEHDRTGSVCRHRAEDTSGEFIQFRSAPAGSLGSEADFTSFDADGFTINWPTSDAHARWGTGLFFADKLITMSRSVPVSMFKSSTFNRNYQRIFSNVKSS